MEKTYTFKTPGGANVTMTISISADSGWPLVKEAAISPVPDETMISPKKSITKVRNSAGKYIECLYFGEVVSAGGAARKLYAQIPEEICEEIHRIHHDECKAIVKFIVVGWESHYVSVDTHKDIETQLRAIAADYKQDCITYEHVLTAYKDASMEKEEKPVVPRAPQPKKEKEWDCLHNEGGEGYNPYRD